MNKWLAGLCLLGGVSFISSPVWSAPTTHKFIEAQLLQFGIQVTSIEKSPVSGLLTIYTNRGLFFASADGQFLIQGNVFDMKNEASVNEQLLAGVRKAGIKKFAASAIEYKSANEKHVISVFTDVNCGYCRKFHSEIQSYLDAGITVRYLAYPRDGINGQTFLDLQSIWCSSDQKAALTAAKSGETIPAKTCPNNIAEQFEMGMSVGVTGTPAILLPDGNLLPGYRPAAQLLQQLQMNAVTSAKG